MLNTDSQSEDPLKRDVDDQSAGLPHESAGLPHVRSSVPTNETGIAEGTVFNVLIPLGLLAVGVFLVLALGKVEPKARPEVDKTRAGRMQALATVRVEKLRSLKSTGQQLQLEVDGNVVPYREAVVAAEVSGRVVYKSDACEAGSVVKKGQVLMRIDPTDYELDLDKFTRQKESDYQAIVEIDQEMANSKRLIKVAQSDQELQKREVKRQESLPRGFSSRGEIDQAKRALLQSTQQLVSAQNELEMLKKRRVRLEAAEKLAAASLRGAEMNLKRTEVIAPIDGVIVLENADLNTFVSRGSPLVTIDDTSKVEVATSLRMDQLYWVLDQADELLANQESGYHLPETPAIIEYELAGRDDVVYRWKGRLLSYDGIGLDTATRTVPVRVVVDDPQSYLDADADEKAGSGTTALLRGMFVRVKLLLKPNTNLVVIPGAALKPGNQVWEFMPDESVLNVPPDETSDDPALQDVAETKQSEEEQKDSTGPKADFNVDQWVAGKVIVRHSIYPVDSLSVSSDNSMASDEDELSDDQFSSELGSEKRMWVCEIRHEDIGDSSFVVMSPLGSVDSEGLPARADKHSIMKSPAMTQADDHEQASIENNESDHQPGDAT